MEGLAAPPAEGAPPKPQVTHPPTPHHPIALPIHGGSPPLGAAVAGPPHPHPKVPSTHGGGHARHPAMLLPHPRILPANAPTRPGADMDTPRITHVPAQPRQRHHTATFTHTGTSTHRSPGKVRAHARCPDPHPCSPYSQDPASYARPCSPGPSAVPDGTLLRLRLHNLHHHNHLIDHHHNHVLIQHAKPQTAGKTSRTAPQTRPQREQPRRRQSTRPDEARASSPATTQDRRQAAAQTRRRAAAATRSQTQAAA